MDEENLQDRYSLTIAIIEGLRDRCRASEHRCSELEAEVKMLKLKCGESQVEENVGHVRKLRIA